MNDFIIDQNEYRLNVNSYFYSLRDNAEFSCLLRLLANMQEKLQQTGKIELHVPEIKDFNHDYIMNIIHFEN